MHAVVTLSVGLGRGIQMRLRAGRVCSGSCGAACTQLSTGRTPCTGGVRVACSDGDVPAGGRNTPHARRDTNSF